MNLEKFIKTHGVSYGFIQQLFRDKSARTTTSRIPDELQQHFRSLRVSVGKGPFQYNLGKEDQELILFLWDTTVRFKNRYKIAMKRFNL